MKIQYIVSEHGGPFDDQSKNEVINFPDNTSWLTIVRTVKKKLGINGVKCDATQSLFGMVTLKQRNSSRVIYIQYAENGVW